MAESPLESVAPIQHYIDPVAAFARTAIRSRAAVDLVAESEIVAGLAHPVAKVCRVVPQDVDTDIHPWRDDVPHIPLSQQNRVAVELVNRPADPSLGAQNVATPRGVTTTNVDVGALKVRAQQNRAGCRGRPGQEPFRAPSIQIIADQPAT